MQGASPLAERSGVDHAYIIASRPVPRRPRSDEVVDKLVSALTPPKRDAEILRFLVGHSSIDVKLIEFVRS